MPESLTQILFTRIDWVWRLFATALSFASFGAGSLVLGVLVFPFFWILIKNPERRRGTARRMVTGGFGLFVNVMNGLGVLRYRIGGLDIANSAQGCLIVANHPTLIDVVFLLSVFRDADCVVKSAMWSNPFTMATVRAIDYIPNEDPTIVMAECVKRLKAGNNLILFPEGTRSIPGQALNFGRGAATIAVRAGAPCLPVLFQCSPMTLTKSEPWYRIPAKRVLFEMEILPPIPVQSFIDESTSEKNASLALNGLLHETLSQHVEITV
ncbi:MAG: 1-acyl-sn-glycerol-3-phosphate acyltransferase [Gammaproteobacteria bacterium]|nr:1-acyl-sn-glycerol-3-phosphate acyltransferase [Gammaproteobacteria bacterium]